MVTQFGGQTPLKLARAIEEGARGSSGRLRDRPRRGPALRLARPRARRPLPAVGDRGKAPLRRRRGGADRLPGARPPVVRARRAGDAGLLRRQPARGGDACGGGTGPRRPLRRARDRARRRRALRRRGRLHRRQSQHVEEAGVHSGDSACVLPAPSLTLPAALEVEHVVKRLGPAGRRRAAERPARDRRRHRVRPRGEPRASRTVPFAGKAIVNLVDAACRLRPARPPRPGAARARDPRRSA